MNTKAILVSMLLAVTAMGNVADAKGCFKGAVVGGVAGHVAGHHTLAGAAIGCAVGHHMAKKKAAAAKMQAKHS